MSVNPQTLYLAPTVRSLGVSDFAGLQEAQRPYVLRQIYEGPEAQPQGLSHSWGQLLTHGVSAGAALPVVPDE
jgi:hypothetical protein